MHRKPAQVGLFYPATREACTTVLQDCLRDCIKVEISPIIAGVVPHAGWTFSGPTAGKVYRTIEKTMAPTTFIILGAVHTYGVSMAAIWSQGRWETPLGNITIDDELADKILKNSNGLIVDDQDVHASEHSIEVQVPFIQYLFPNATLVPIMVAPFPEAHKIGELIADAIGGKENVVVLASTDLTHYGRRFGFTPHGLNYQALQWSKRENDRRMIDLMLQVKPEKIVTEARTHFNACGSGAVAAVLGYVRRLGRNSGILVEHTASFEVYHEQTPDCSIGYAGVIF